MKLTIEEIVDKYGDVDLSRNEDYYDTSFFVMLLGEKDQYTIKILLGGQPGFVKRYIYKPITIKQLIENIELIHRIYIVETTSDFCEYSWTRIGPAPENI